MTEESQWSYPGRCSCCRGSQFPPLAFAFSARITRWRRFGLLRAGVNFSGESEPFELVSISIPSCKNFAKSGEPISKPRSSARSASSSFPSASVAAAKMRAANEYKWRHTNATSFQYPRCSCSHAKRSRDSALDATTCQSTFSVSNACSKSDITSEHHVPPLDNNSERRKKEISLCTTQQ